MKKKLLSGLLVIVLLFGITGCGSDKKEKDSEDNSKIANKLNKIVKKSVDSWDEDGYAHTFSLSDIDDTLEDEGEKYVIIASGDKKFEEAPEVKRYTYDEDDFDDYEGTLYSKYRMLEEDNDVKYVVVLDKKSEKYYMLEIKYKTKKVNKVEKEYPYFENESKLK